MALRALIQKRQSGEVATAIPAIPATDGFTGTGNGNKLPSKIAKIATIAIANPPEPCFSDSAAESRRQRVLAILSGNPCVNLAVVCDGHGDPVPVAIGIRGKGTCEVHIPASRFDPSALLDLVNRHAGRTTLQ